MIETVQKAKENGLKTLVIGQNPQMILDYDSLDTDYLSFEKEDLIASEVSMIDQQEGAIKELVMKLKHPLIIGAGINDGEDTKKSKAAGAVGVLMATYFVTALDPEKKLRELARGFL